MKTKIGIVKGEETCDIETRDKLSTHDRHPHNDAEYLNSIPRLPQPRRGDVINQTLVTTPFSPERGPSQSPTSFLWFLLSIYLFPRLISAFADWMSPILLHMVALVRI